MAALITCSDLGAQENKAFHYFHCFPIYLPWSDGTGCHVYRATKKCEPLCAHVQLRLVKAMLLSPLRCCFHCLKWPANVVLKCSLVLLSLIEACCVLQRKYVLDKLHSLNLMSYRVVGCELNVSESTILFFKVSLNTHKENKGREQLCVDQLMKILWPDAHSSPTLYFPLEQWVTIHYFSVRGNIIEGNHCR